MAERRMMTKKVTDDDRFMNLSSSAQALYLHLNMSADDDGFCNQVSVAMFKAHASVQDLEALLAARYLLQFDSGVIVIKHWRMANALRKDRYTPTSFQDEMSKLKLKKNGAYSEISEEDLPKASEDGAPKLMADETARQAAYRESELPYSFDYKIRNAFYGRPCPICGAKMARSVDDAGIPSDNRIPTIQHNIPISKGGKHELGNISVICRQCNISIQDEETGELNAAEVAEEWEKISGCRLDANCLPQVRLDQDREGKKCVCVGARDNEPDDPDEDDGFDEFWAAYPSKSGDIRQAYFEYLGVLKSGVDPKTLLDAVKWQREAKEPRYMGSAEKWLRNKGWTERKPDPKPLGRNAPAACKDYGTVTVADYDFEGKL